MVISAMEKIYINQGNIMGHGKVGMGGLEQHFKEGGQGNTH